MYRRGWASPYLYILAGVLFFLPSCTFFINRSYSEQYPQYRGIRRVTVFIQRWPAYQQLPKQNEPGADFIKKSTFFTGPWEAAGLINPRAVDVQDIDDEIMATLLTRSLKKRGYQPLISRVFPVLSGPITVEEIMTQSQAVAPWVDAFLFCFYSPTVFCAKAQATPKDHQTRSYGLQELVDTLNPGADYVIWAGPSAGQAPPNSISHAFIYVSLTMFKALDRKPLWEVADSQVGGPVRAKLLLCPPFPTDRNYRASAAIIKRLMCDNLSCRMERLIPHAF